VNPMRTSGVRWAWLLAATFFVASIITILVSQHITAPAPKIAPDAQLPDIIFANFEATQAAWLQLVASAVLFSIGFLAIAVLGPTLRSLLDRSDPRATRLAVFLVVAGVIGILSQIIYLAAQDVAAQPHYCQCDYAAPELISRGAVLDVLSGVQGWLVDTFSLLFAIGLLAAAGLGRKAAWPAGLVRTSQVLALLGLAAVAWDRIATPLLANANVSLDYEGIGFAIVGLLAGIGTPLWALLLARSLSTGRDAVTRSDEVVGG
jgi:hypothetical protein